MNIADFRPSKRIQPWKHYTKNQEPYSLDIRYIGADPNKDMAMMSGDVGVNPTDFDKIGQPATPEMPLGVMRLVIPG